MTPRVLVAGGGVAGLETALALRVLAGDRVAVTLLAAERHFTYRPLAVAEPFGRAAPVRLDLARLAAARGFTAVRDVLDGVDAERRLVVTQDESHLEYDELVLALGARPRVAVPGALTFRGPRDVPRLARALSYLQAARGPARVAFAAAAETTWTLPLYELALLTGVWGAERGLQLELSIHTGERAALEAFGPPASEQVAQLLADRGIALHLSSPASRFADGRLLAGRRRAAADLVVALPALVGPAVRGIPSDDSGFTPVDRLCRVCGVEDVHAVGDMTAGSLKQGGLAAQQADVAAADIAAAAGAAVAVEPYVPVLRGLLLTGGRPLYLRNPPATRETLPAGADLTSPWWPPHKIAGRHLAPFLATHGELLEQAAV